MFLALIFILIMVLGVGLVLYFTKPSETDVAVRKGLARLSTVQVVVGAGDDAILKKEWLSPSVGIHDMLARLPLSWRLHSLIKQAGSRWWVSDTLSYCVGAAAVAWLVTLIFVPNQALHWIITLAMAGAPIAYLFFLRYQKLKACNILLPQAVDLMGRALRAGLSLNSAIEMAGNDIPEPLGSEFRTVYEEQALGLPFRDAIVNLLERLPLGDMRFLTSALLLQKDTGGNLVQILDTVSLVMKERIRIRGRIKIYTAQARMSGWFVGAMPFIMYILISIANPEYASLLVTDPSGRMAAYIGLVSWVCGVLVIRKIIAIKV